MTRKEGVLALEAYFDDAGSPDDPQVVCWGGFIGSSNDWYHLDKRWREILADPIGDGSKPSLKKGFHLSHCVGTFGEFEQYRRVERDYVRRRFRDLLGPYTLESGLSTAIYPIGYAIHRPEYDELITGQLQKLLGKPSFHCLKCCIERAIHFTSRYDGMGLSIVVDKGAYSADISEAVNELLAKYIGNASITIISESVQKCIPLQAADMIATELRWSAIIEKGGTLPDEQNDHMRHIDHLINKLLDDDDGGAYVARRGELESTANRIQALIDAREIGIPRGRP